MKRPKRQAPKKMQKRHPRRQRKKIPPQEAKKIHSDLVGLENQLWRIAFAGLAAALVLHLDLTPPKRKPRSLPLIEPPSYIEPTDTPEE